jgi:hypothetical protein
MQDKGGDSTRILKHMFRNLGQQGNDVQVSIISFYVVIDGYLLSKHVYYLYCVVLNMLRL